MLNSQALILRSRAQAAALAGSTGQGACRCCHQSPVLTAIISPEKVNNTSLCADNHIMPGIAEVRPAITAPAPIEISNAGSAQHSSVEVLPNNARVGATESRQSPLISRYRAQHRPVGLPRSCSQLARRARRLCHRSGWCRARIQGSRLLYQGQHKRRRPRRAC